MFTNVPIGETIDYLCTYIESNGIDVALPTDDLKELLFFCTHNVQFNFNEEIYRQKDSVAMGSPLRPVFADLFMSKIENSPLKTHIKQCVLYKRYVDDILCVIDDAKERLLALQTTFIDQVAIMDDLNLFYRIKYANFCADTVRKTKLSTITKLQISLLHRLAENRFPNQPEKLVKNLSSVELNELRLQALSCGLRFCVAPKKINSIDSQAQFEYFFEQLKMLKATSKDAESWIKAKLVDLERQYRTTPSKQKSLLTPEHVSALQKLREKSDLIILHPDKGSVAVLMAVQITKERWTASSTTLASCYEKRHVTNQQSWSIKLSLKFSSYWRDISLMRTLPEL
ncbi:unnamed protein product [Echinostoma caproni]|uniref:Reverse transcriptase domain-containing protein n=1 Tax=Echinostoma caproni TaxID=27848 RepID=A0A3P8L9S4_9TREM|nr:unnamed protein product [Echinostoma caproni]